MRESTFVFNCFSDGDQSNTERVTNDVLIGHSLSWQRNKSFHLVTSSCAAGEHRTGMVYAKTWAVPIPDPD
jgi:hypothetical protein